MRRLLPAIFCLSLCFTVRTDFAVAEPPAARLERNLVPLTIPSLSAQFTDSLLTASEPVTLLQRMAHYAVPGVSIAVVHDRELALAAGYGVMGDASGTPVTPETCFEAGSTSKLITTIMALRMVQDGRLGLDTDVNDDLSSWRIPENELTVDRKVTLRRLLTHTAGLTRPEGGFAEEPGSTPTLVQHLSGEAPAQTRPALVVAEPGSGWDYSNHGYLVVQLLLEDVMGQPYSRLAERWVFEPLGMASSTFIHPLPEGIHARTALPHDPDGIAHDRPQSPFILAQGGLVTTPSDLARLIIELMETYAGHSDVLLSPESVRRMLTEQVPLEPERLFGMTEGLGVFLDLAGPSLIFSHLGFNAPGSTCLLLALPEEGCGLAVMTNGSQGMQLSLEILASAIIAYGWPRTS